MALLARDDVRLSAPGPVSPDAWNGAGRKVRRPRRLLHMGLVATLLSAPAAASVTATDGTPGLLQRASGWWAGPEPAPSDATMTLRECELLLELGYMSDCSRFKDPSVDRFNAIGGDCGRLKELGYVSHCPASRPDDPMDTGIAGIHTRTTSYGCMPVD